MADFLNLCNHAIMFTHITPNCLTLWSITQKPFNNKTHEHDTKVTTTNFNYMQIERKFHNIKQTNLQ